MSNGNLSTSPKPSNVSKAKVVNLTIPDRTLKALTQQRKDYLFKQGTNMKKLRNTIRVSEISKLTNVPIALIWGIILVPTGGKEFPIVNKNGGICNLNYNVVRNALISEVKNGRLSGAENDWLGAEPSVKGNMQNPILDLSQDNLNVFLGAIYLGQLLDKYKSNQAIKVFYESQHSLPDAQSYYSNFMGSGGMLELILDAI